MNSQHTIAVVRAVRNTNSLSWSSVNVVPGISTMPTRTVVNSATVTTRRSTFERGEPADDQIDEERRGQHAEDLHQEQRCGARE